jgi:hypothetical protein
VATVLRGGSQRKLTRKDAEAITKGEQAIQQRLADCPPISMDAAEEQAIGDNLAALAVLKTEIL